MTADGGHQTRLIEADDLHAASWPAWSPDQSWIAFVRWTASGGNPVDADVWVAAADGSDAHAIVGGPGWQWIPHWSPDGTRIAFTQEASGGPWMATGPTGPDVAPGPQGAAFGDPAATRTHATIWMVSADGTGSPVQVTNGSADDRAAAFSPDGTRLVLDSTRDGDTNLYVVNLDGTNAVRITDDPGEDWGASWSPDGTRIVFNSDATGKSQIYVVPATGGTPTQLSHEPGWAREPTWSPDGTRIAYEAIAEDNSTSSIVSIAADGGDRRDLSNTATTSESLGGSSDAWGRDGRIVYERDEALPATAQPIVREDLAVAAMLLTTAILSLLVVVLARTGPPFGAYTITLGLGVLVVALAGGNGRFVFAALLAGLLVDVLVRFTPQRLVASVVGAVSGAAFVVLAIVAVVATTGLGWSPALVLGVPIAAGLIGWGIAAVASGGPSPTEAAAPA
jgi:TolB protein